MKEGARDASSSSAVLRMGAISGGVAVAAGGDDDATDTPIAGASLAKASAAALEHTGGGKAAERDRDGANED
jgi:hypothetical protein